MLQARSNPNPRFEFRISAVAVLLFGLVGSVCAADWPQFLGPNRNGISSETGLHHDWSFRFRRPRRVWKVRLGGGFSSPIVVAGRLYVLAEQSRRDYAFCFDAESGAEIWKTPLGKTYVDRQRQGTGPRATPTFHEGNLYCQLGGGDLLRLDAKSGKIQWRTNIIAISDAPDRSTELYYWGVAGSPLIEGDLVIAQPGGPRDNSVIALDKDSGKLVWGAGDDPPGYASPLAITVDGQREIVSLTGQSLLGLAPADGKVLWRVRFGNRYNCNCASPLWADETLFISAAYGSGATAIKVAAAGGVHGAIDVWRNRRFQNQFATSVILDGTVYGPHGDNAGVTFRCLDLKTGRLNWTTRGPGKCTMVAAEGHLYCLTANGDLVLVKADPKRYFEQGRFENLLGPKSWAPPALSNGRLYARDQRHLVCVDVR